MIEQKLTITVTKIISITNSTPVPNLALKLSVSVWHWQPAHRCVYGNHSHSDNQQVHCWYSNQCDGGRQVCVILA